MRPEWARALFASGLLVAAGCKGCGEPAVVEPPLSQVADEVQFESVERLGSHTFRAAIQRVRRAGTDEMSRSDELIETTWKDWDNFEHRRLRDGELKSGVKVVDGKAWMRRLSASWTRSDDAEPHRVQLRSTWRTWDEALEQFGDRIALSQETTTVHEGRPARRYVVGLTEVDEASTQRVRRTSSMWPKSLEGFVVIDAATAIRLEALVTGVVQDGETEREVRLELSRTGIGAEVVLEAPGEKRREARAKAKANRAAKRAKAAEATLQPEGQDAVDEAPNEGADPVGVDPAAPPEP